VGSSGVCGRNVGNFGELLPANRGGQNAQNPRATAQGSVGLPHRVRILGKRFSGSYL
jgi:hypothetical protein